MAACAGIEPDSRVRALRLYVHVPYCVHKCHYCDFNSHVRREPDWDDWLAACLRDWRRQVRERRRLASVFIGGGTPSLLPAGILDALLQGIADALAPDAEITLEANPGTADAARFRDYRQAGVNRLSIGVQSLRADELRWLERIHDPSQARDAYAMARRAGFDNVNLDLMYALPGQSLDDWLATLREACRLEPEHLSCYQLTVEPGTRLAAMQARQRMSWPSETQAADFFTRTREYLEDEGFIAYEVSNHARPGYHCQHNDGYWRYDDYIGIGPGAAGKLDRNDGGSIRWSNIRTPEGYARAMIGQGRAIAEEEKLDIEHAAREAFWLGLRRSEGVEHTSFVRRFSPPLLTRCQQACQQWIQAGLLHSDARATRIVGEGWLLADEIAGSVFG